MSDLRRIIWLASYPKSGNTWLRSLLAHYFMPPGKAPDINNLRRFTTSDVRQDFYDMAVGGTYYSETLEGWLKVRPQAMRLIAGSKMGKHFVKTHCRPMILQGTHLIPPEVTAGAIYVLRNPFDVAPSFNRHVGGTMDNTLERMFDPDNTMATGEGMFDALGRWDEHIENWTAAPGLPLHVIRYEDMLSHSAKSMRGLLTFLGVKQDGPKLAKAIKANSFNALKKQEEKEGFRERPEGMKSFFTKGKAGSWREDLTPQQVARIREEFMPALEKWYPEMLRETAEYAAGG